MKKNFVTDFMRCGASGWCMECRPAWIPFFSIKTDSSPAALLSGCSPYTVWQPASPPCAKSWGSIILLYAAQSICFAFTPRNIPLVPSLKNGMPAPGITAGQNGITAV